MSTDIEKRVLRELTSDARQYVWVKKKPPQPDYVFKVDGVEYKYKSKTKKKDKEDDEEEDDEDDEGEEEEELSNNKVVTPKPPNSSSTTSATVSANDNHSLTAASNSTSTSKNNLSRPFNQFATASNQFATANNQFAPVQYSNYYQPNFAQSYGNYYYPQPEQIGSLINNQSSYFPNTYSYNSDVPISSYKVTNNREESSPEKIDDEEATRDTM